MRQSRAFLHTLREPPSDAEVVSHRLLAQAGFIQKLGAGIYSYTPAMWRVLKKISEIVRQEMDAAGAQEVMLPILQPREIWDSSGRWDRYVKDGILFHFKDRKQSEVCLGPTHEEVITNLVDKFVTSYKQLPVNLYQIQTKFRDEIRPRFGLMRAREFIMKDAYSFDLDDAGLDKSYEAMAVAYRNIFTRCGLDFAVVDADSGAIGGAASQEFIVKAETGEDAFLVCEATGYAANQERAISVLPAPSTSGGAPLPLEKIATPNARTMDELVNFFPGRARDQFAKTILYKAVLRESEQLVAVMIRGDQEINEVKLVNALDALAIALANENEIRHATGADVGFAGPVGLQKDVKLLADESVRGLVNFVAGGNESGYHYVNVNPGRDFPTPTFVDVRLARAGEKCVVTDPDHAKLPPEALQLTSTRGIEVGHIFKLGSKYSKAMEATFTAESGGEQPFVMGCYGIGVSRIAAAAVEQCHDAKGIRWPKEIAPWAVHLICMNPKIEAQQQLAEKLYAELVSGGIEVLYDDRVASPGVKFNDADLVGLPVRIIVGRDAADGNVEFASRENPKAGTKIPATEVISRL